MVAGEYRILVVDDNSPDGTGAIADSLGPTSWTRSTCCTAPPRPASGRRIWPASPARCAGAPSCVIEMDADFSHDPRYLPQLIGAAERRRPRARLPLRPGRRRARLGAGAPADQPRAAACTRALILGVHVQDLTGGFKCIRREVLEAIDLRPVRAEGYVFQIEVTYRALLAGFTVREVPIVFADRTAGKSKMSSRIALEAMWMVPALRRASAPGDAATGASPG